MFLINQEFDNGNFERRTNQFFGIEDLPDAELLAPFTPPASEEIQNAVDNGLAALKDGSFDPPATLK